VREIIGHYENCEVKDGPDGQAELHADLVTFDGDQYQWVRTIIESALSYAGRFDDQLVGLSINASGNSEKKDIDNLIGDENLPVSTKPKLLKAKNEGATEIEYCTELLEAVSVDMVTEAGAKGRFVKMIESERARMATKTAKQIEDEKIAAAKKSKEGAPPVPPKKPADPDKPDGTEPPAPGADHPDAEQDKALMGGMLKKYVGGDDHTDEQHEAMHQAYQHAKEMGLEGEEAEAMAGHSMKMAHHIAQKKEKDKKETADGSSDPDKKAENEKKEADVIKLHGRIAILEASLTSEKIEKLTAKIIRESGFDTSIEKSFMKAIGTPKSEKELSEKATIFKEALDAASGPAGFINPEKQINSSGAGGRGSLAHCIEGNE
jgi:hypothetical protein